MGESYSKEREKETGKVYPRETAGVGTGGMGQSGGNCENSCAVINKLTYVKKTKTNEV